MLTYMPGLIQRGIMCTSGPFDILQLMLLFYSRCKYHPEVSSSGFFTHTRPNSALFHTAHQQALCMFSWITHTGRVRNNKKNSVVIFAPHRPKFWGNALGSLCKIQKSRSKPIALTCGQLHLPPRISSCKEIYWPTVFGHSITHLFNIQSGFNVIATPFRL